MLNCYLPSPKRVMLSLNPLRQALWAPWPGLWTSSRLCRMTTFRRHDNLVNPFSLFAVLIMLQILFIYCSIINLLCSPEDVNNLVVRLSSESPLIQNETISQLFAFILHRSAGRGDSIGASVIERLLEAKTLSRRVSAALVAYVSAVDVEELQGINYYKAQTAEHTAVVCAMISKLETVRDKALSQLEKNLMAGNKVQMFSECFSALIKAYSVACDGDAEFAWADSADEEVKAKLQSIFDTTQKELLTSALDVAQVDVLLRAVSLFPSLDREHVLRHISTDRKRSALTENTVTLVNALLEDSNDATKPEMKRWFLMVFDHLTRRFAEDAILSCKVIAFAKALGILILPHYQGYFNDCWSRWIHCKEGDQARECYPKVHIERRIGGGPGKAYQCPRGCLLGHQLGLDVVTKIA